MCLKCQGWNSWPVWPPSQSTIRCKGVHFRGVQEIMRQNQFLMSDSAEICLAAFNHLFCKHSSELLTQILKKWGDEISTCQHYSLPYKEHWAAFSLKNGNFILTVLVWYTVRLFQLIVQIRICPSIFFCMFYLIWVFAIKLKEKYRFCVPNMFYIIKLYVFLRSITI
jgi:hypothetical protein